MRWTLLLCFGCGTSIAADAPNADGFDFPVGPPDARGWYDAQPFGKNRMCRLGQLAPRSAAGDEFMLVLAKIR